MLSFISLDGVMQAPGGPEEDTSNGFKFGGWVFPYFDEFGGKVMSDQMKGTYDLLLGRKTYDIFAAYWPEHADKWPQVNTITKYVLSHGHPNLSWNKSVLLKDVADIKKLKTQPGQDLQVHGSGNLIQTLLKHDLVDEFWLKIFPITLGKGKKLFDFGTIPAAFSAYDVKHSPSGVIVASYKRTGEVKTASF